LQLTWAFQIENLALDENFEGKPSEKNVIGTKIVFAYVIGHGEA
jgi:hypothetical protein